MARQAASAQDHGTPAYLDPDLPIERRVDDLAARMTLEEKASQMLNASPAIERLGIPAYDWWSECLHGVARAGVATVFPQAIGLAATCDDELILNAAVVISNEARAKHHEFARRGETGACKGLTFWSPNINIFRDPRWGRGQETYGEDPCLTSRIGVAFVKGLQGDHPRYLKTVATPKHFAVHSGPEPKRHSFDARVSLKDLRETYLPAFKACVVEGRAASIMGAYNRTNGEPCCASPTLLTRILREEWGFNGYVVSDCGAICDFHAHHKITLRPPESAALAVNNGCDLNCGRTYEHLLNAVEEGLTTEEAIDRCLKRSLTARFRLGMFDPPGRVTYAQIPPDVNDCPAHNDLALQVARESIVLLRNDGPLLPLRRTLRRIAVIGPNADSLDVLLGNYNGEPSAPVTLLEGIRTRAGGDIEVLHARGCELTGSATDGFDEALAACRQADVVVACLGLSPRLEGEEGDAADSEANGDRIHLGLPGVQEQLLQAIHATGVPMVLVLCNGSPLAVNWADEHVPAIIEAWYPGQQGGNAVADVLFGDYCPAGRLPITFAKSADQLPPFEDYSMKGRTYRYMEAEPLYPFGHGLSYTRFRYRDLKLSGRRIGTDESLEISVDVENVGPCAGDEVVQLYLSDIEASAPGPIRELRGFKRIGLRPGQTQRVTFMLTPRDLAMIDEQGRCMLEPGEFIVSVGGGQPNSRSQSADGSNVQTARFEVVGTTIELPY